MLRVVSRLEARSPKRASNPDPVRASPRPINLFRDRRLLPCLLADGKDVSGDLVGCARPLVDGERAAVAEGRLTCQASYTACGGTEIEPTLSNERCKVPSSPRDVDSSVDGYMLNSG